MSGTTETTDAKHEQAHALIDEGLCEAKAIGNPIARSRHRAAWALRLSAIDPEAAAELAAELGDDPEAEARLLLMATTDRALRGDTNLEPHFTRTLELAETLDADARLRIINSLCEVGIDIGERDQAAALALLQRLVPAVRGLTVPDATFQQFRVLGSALVGEALMVLEDPAGIELLEEAERESAELPSRDPILVFLANAMIVRDPTRAADMLDTLQDPALRMDARLQSAAAIEDPALRGRLFDGAEADAMLIEHYRGPEALVRMGGALATLDPERAAGFFQRALAGAEASGAQLRSLQWTGVASVMAPVDRDWALRIFQDAEAAAREEDERVRRVTALVLIANEMAEPFPREAQAAFQYAMDEALELDAMWEYAHVMDVVFHSDRSEFLDISAVRPLLDRVLERLADDDPRIPGVMGLAEVAQAMMQLDQEQGALVLQRWFDAAARSTDTDGMTQAALALYRVDPARGHEALSEVRDLLLRRIDCPSMGEFSRTAATAAPDLVLAIAPHIPDRRERADAVAAAAIGLYATDPAQSLTLLRQLERPVDRSHALMRVVDGLLGTGDRPEPQPLLEDLP